MCSSIYYDCPWLKTELITLITCALIIGCGGKTPSQLQVTTPTNCRPVQHALGETCVSIQPERVLVSDQAILANAIALGLQPIGSTLHPNFLSEEAPETQFR